MVKWELAFLCVYTSEGYLDKKLNLFFIMGGVAIGGCLLFCIGLAVFFRYSPDLYIDNSSLKVGKEAPDFTLPALDGGTVTLSQFRGRPVVLSVGASWCPDCRVEAPILQELHEGHPELVVLLVDPNEGVDTVRNFADEFGFTFPVLLDGDGAVSKLYQIVAIPTELFIDADGIIRAKVVESVTDELLMKNLALIGVEP